MVVLDAHTAWKTRDIEIRTGGVDFFFVLSGFLITYIYSGKSERPGEAFAFLQKRLLRIYPLLWFFTILSLPFYFFLRGFGSDIERDPVVIVKSVFLIPMPHQPVFGGGYMVVIAHFIVLLLLCTLSFSEEIRPLPNFNLACMLFPHGPLAGQ